MARKTTKKTNRQNRIRPAKQGRAGKPYSKAERKARALAVFHEEHVLVGEYPNTRWVRIDQEDGRADGDVCPGCGGVCGEPEPTDLDHPYHSCMDCAGGA